MENRLFIFKSEHCVMCGKEIPEGRQVCPECERLFEKAEPSPAEKSDCVSRPLLKKLFPRRKR